MTNQRSKKQADAKAAETSNFIAQYRSLINAEDILKVGMKLGAIERVRKVDLPKLVEATILALGPIPGTQMTSFQNYIALSGEKIAPSTFYDHFNPGFALLMEQVADRGIEAVRDTVPPGSRDADFGVLLEQFKDVRITDSTSHFLKRFAVKWARSTSKVRPAAVKLHATISLRDGLTTHSAITAQRVHDNKAFPPESLAPGTLHLFDLGYIDVARFIDMTADDVFFLTRLKDSHNPEIIRVHQGKGSRAACRGVRLDDALRDAILGSEEGRIDLDVKLVSGEKECIARVVGEVDDTDEWHWYLTNIGRDVLPVGDVPEAYRLRWVVELVFKQSKSGLGLDGILAWRESAVAALLYAKIIALCLARLMERAAQAEQSDHIVTQLAMVLVLARSTGLFIAHRLIAEGVTIEEFERRILLITIIGARARNQRREREKRMRQARLGR